MARRDKDAGLIVVIIVLIVFVLFSGFGMMGFGGMAHKGYGSDFLCRYVGGIWCYWPNWVVVWTFILLIVIVLTFITYWLLKHIKKN